MDSSSWLRALLSGGAGPDAALLAAGVEPGGTLTQPTGIVDAFGHRRMQGQMDVVDRQLAPSIDQQIANKAMLANSNGDPTDVGGRMRRLSAMAPAPEQEQALAQVDPAIVAKLQSQAYLKTPDNRAALQQTGPLNSQPYYQDYLNQARAGADLPAIKYTGEFKNPASPNEPASLDAASARSAAYKNASGRKAAREEKRIAKANNLNDPINARAQMDWLARHGGNPQMVQAQRLMQGNGGIPGDPYFTTALMFGTDAANGRMAAEAQLLDARARMQQAQNGSPLPAITAAKTDPMMADKLGISQEAVNRAKLQDESKSGVSGPITQQTLEGLYNGNWATGAESFGNLDSFLREVNRLAPEIAPQIATDWFNGRTQDNWVNRFGRLLNNGLFNIFGGGGSSPQPSPLAASGASLMTTR